MSRYKPRLVDSCGFPCDVLDHCFSYNPPSLSQPDSQSSAWCLAMGPCICFQQQLLVCLFVWFLLACAMFLVSKKQRLCNSFLLEGNGIRYRAVDTKSPSHFNSSSQRWVSLGSNGLLLDWRHPFLLEFICVQSTSGGLVRRKAAWFVHPVSWHFYAVMCLCFSIVRRIPGEYVEHLCWLAPSRSQARKWRVSVHEVCSSVRDLQARDRKVKDKGLWDQKI